MISVSICLLSLGVIAIAHSCNLLSSVGSELEAAKEKSRWVWKGELNCFNALLSGVFHLHLTFQ